MTIEEVMALAYDLADDNCRVLQPETVKPREDRLHAAILTLISEREDAEAEACAALCQAKHANGQHKYTHRDECEDAIRARVAARKGGKDGR